MILAQSAGAVESLQRGKTLNQRVSCYDTKQSDSETSVMLEL